MRGVNVRKKELSEFNAPHLLRFIIIIVSLSVSAKTFGQDNTKLMRYYWGINYNYPGERSRSLFFPIDIGTSVSATLNRFIKLKPTVELSAAGFPEHVLRLTNNNSNDATHSYGVYSFLVGTKYKLKKLLNVAVTTGPVYNSGEYALLWGIKPLVEYNTKNDIFLVHLYYLKILNSQIINGYTGIGVMLNIR